MQAAHSQNQPILERLLLLQREASTRRNYNLAKGFARPAAALLRYPLPLTSPLALRTIDGVGDFIARKLEPLLAVASQPLPSVASQPLPSVASQQLPAVPPLSQPQQAKKRKAAGLEFEQGSPETMMLLAHYLSTLKGKHGVEREELVELGGALARAVEGVVGRVDPNVEARVPDTRTLAELKSKGFEEAVGNTPKRYYLTAKGSQKVGEVMRRWNVRAAPSGGEVELVYGEVEYDGPARKQTPKLDDRAALSYEARQLVSLLEGRPRLKLSDYTCVDMEEVREHLGGASQGSEATGTWGGLASQSEQKKREEERAGEVVLLVDSREVRTQQDRDYIMVSLQ